MCIRDRWDAVIELTGKNGVRRLPIHDFYIKAGKVDIRAEDGEIQKMCIRARIPALPPAPARRCSPARPASGPVRT